MATLEQVTINRIWPQERRERDDLTPVDIEQLTISQRGFRFIPPNAERPDTVAWGQFARQARDAARTNEVREKWRDVETSLCSWRDGSEEVDDEMVMPSKLAIRCAFEFAKLLRYYSFQSSLTIPVPKVMATGDGGIAFVTDLGQDSMVIEIDECGALEMLHFRGSRLVERTLLAQARVEQ